MKSLIKRNIKTNEIQKRNVNKYNKNQLEALVDDTCKKLGTNRDGLKNLLGIYDLNYENLLKRFQVDLKWNYMIFQIYKNKISLNTVEVESKIKVYLENSKNINEKKDIELIKEKIVNSEKEKKLKMFSNLHYSNLERSIQIKFL